MEEERNEANVKHEPGKSRLVGERLRRHTTGAITFGETVDVCTDSIEFDVVDELVSHPSDGALKKHLQLLVAGGLAGSVGKTCTAPLSRLTILYQVHSMVSARGAEMYSRSLGSAIYKVCTNEGVLALWKGNGTSVLHRFPYSAINFVTYETVKNHLVSKEKALERNRGVNFVSGACAGAAATIICYPLDLIRTRLATQLDKNIHYRGISHAFHRITEEEGVRGLYRGMGTTLAVTVPNLAINFTMYESLKHTRQQYLEKLRPSQEVELRTADLLACGALSGITSSIITFPIDVIRRRLQLSGIFESSRGNGPITVARSLFQEQGLKGFYRGLAPELLKVVPMVGITFVSFEKMKMFIDIDS